MLLGHSVNRFATASDVLRAWARLGPGDLPPKQNPISKGQWRKLVGKSLEENESFGRLRIGQWTGHFFKRTRHPRRWAPASNRVISARDWERAWPTLLGQIQSEQLEILKSSRSGDVLAGEVVLDGQPLPIVVKRPYRRYWYRYINEIGRGHRARRAWRKAWTLIARDLPTAWPLLLMEKRTLGYTTDAVIVFERVPGPTLAAVDLDAMPVNDRDTLFRRAGRTLRLIDSHGYAHFDAKATNWIVQSDDKLGPRPVLVDVDGIRHRRWPALGIERLLRAMRDHQQYTPADSLALCQGYAPYSRLVQEEIS
jgi:tRNA A-37 threonylcarbamoyl transferase component Bud32